MKGCVALWLAVLLCLAGNVTAERVFGGAVAHSAGDTRGWLVGAPSHHDLSARQVLTVDLPGEATEAGVTPRKPKDTRLYGWRRWLEVGGAPTSHRASQRSLLGAQHLTRSTVPNATRSNTRNWRMYGKQQAAKIGWTGPQWQALDMIVTPESDWNPCRRYPSVTDCGYAGSNSCGIPQRNPCPEAWRGRLGSTGRLQVRELLRYIRGRYGDPLRALAFRRSAGWY